MEEVSSVTAADREELERLYQKRFLLTKRIGKLRQALGLARETEFPHHKCKRCDYEWMGRIVHRLPTSCPRCHSCLWNEEPSGHKRTYRPARKPTDEPNPNWESNWGRKNEKKSDEPAPPALPPPPRSFSSATGKTFDVGLPRPVSLSEQLVQRLQESPQPERSSRPREEPEHEPAPTNE